MTISNVLNKTKEEKKRKKNPAQSASSAVNPTYDQRPTNQQATSEGESSTEHLALVARGDSGGDADEGAERASGGEGAGRERMARHLQSSSLLAGERK